MKKILTALVAMAVFSGCASQVTEAGYYWGDYSNTLYIYTKDPNEKTLAKHVEELEDIIVESNERELRVPPGVYAELGYIKAQQGFAGEAAEAYNNEAQLYPESKVFLERLTSMNEPGS